MGGSLVEQASRMACKAHAGKQYGKLPYDTHLRAVAAVLGRFGVNRPVIVAAAWLHDVVEDTELTVENLRLRFQGQVEQEVEAVLAIVDACTDGQGTTRAERKERPYTLIPRTPDAILVKLADRIANIEACRAGDDARRMRMYRKEHATFATKLRREGDSTVSAMWDYLEAMVEN